MENLFKTGYFKTGLDTFTEEIPSKFAISRHADNVSCSISNQYLSEKKANAVKNYAVPKGVSLSNKTTKSFGGDMSIVSNKTRAGRAQNRRVEIKLIH